MSSPFSSSFANSDVDFHFLNESSVTQSESGDVHSLPYQILDIASHVSGWTFFVSWSVMLYPQLWINYRRKSVVGLSFDFVALYFVGSVCGTLFHAFLYFDAATQALYFRQYSESRIPIGLNDVFHAFHLQLIMIVIVLQCLLYESGEQKISKTGWSLLGSSATVAAALAVLPMLTDYSYLLLLFYFSYIKLAFTLLKDFAQMWSNYKRKSTSGFSVVFVILDMTGGFFCDLQMILNAILHGNWIPLLTNISKFALGLLTIALCLVYLVQHYVLYGVSKKKFPRVCRLFNFGLTRQLDIEKSLVIQANNFV